MVSLGIRDESIITFILLLENVKDVEVINIANKQKETYDDLENKLKLSKIDIESSVEDIYSKYSLFKMDIKATSEYEAIKKLHIVEAILNGVIKTKLSESGIPKQTKTLVDKRYSHDKLLNNGIIKSKQLESLRYSYQLKYNWSSEIGVGLDRLIDNTLTCGHIM